LRKSYRFGKINDGIVNDFTNRYSSNSIAVALDAVTDLLSYCRQKALYDADCRLREKAAEIRSARYTAESDRCLCVTKELARCKIKLKLLKTEIENETSQNIKELFLPLLKDLENRIINLRESRSHL
jgi:hypothetical protein